MGRMTTRVVRAVTLDTRLTEVSVARADDIDDESGGDDVRAADTDAFWEDLRIDPVEIALPSGVGYTLRAYRMSSQITPTDTSEREDDIELPSYRSPADEDDLDADLEAGAESDGGAETDSDEEIDSREEGADLDEADLDENDAEDLDEDELALVEDDEESEPEPAPDEEVPLFLSNAGHLLLFKTADALVEYVRSDSSNDLAQLDEWEKLRSDLQAEHVVALPDDQYELDLVVKNLRGGPEVWDASLIVQSGQLARDLAYALRMESVLLALSSSSPLDDLDEALRIVEAGGVGAFFARRRARKVGKETASLAWRTVIGKISTVVDWRE